MSTKNRKPEAGNGYLDGSGTSPFAARADHTHEDGGGSGGDYAPKVHTHKVADITDIEGKYANAEHTHAAKDITDGEETFAKKTHTHAAKDITDLVEHVAAVEIAVADWQEGQSVVKEIEGVKASAPFAFVVDPADEETASTATFKYTSREDGKVTFGCTETPSSPIKLLAIF